MDWVAYFKKILHKSLVVSVLRAVHSFNLLPFLNGFLFILKLDYSLFWLVKIAIAEQLSRSNKTLMVVAQLAEQSLPIPDVRGSNPVIDKIL